jgi:hypothetical protein
MKKDAEQEIAHMQYRLALDFEKGNGVTKDLEEGVFLALEGCRPRTCASTTQEPNASQGVQGGHSDPQNLW